MQCTDYSLLSRIDFPFSRLIATDAAWLAAYSASSRTLLYWFHHPGSAVPLLHSTWLRFGRNSFRAGPSFLRIVMDLSPVAVFVCWSMPRRHCQYHSRVYLVRCRALRAKKQTKIHCGKTECEKDLEEILIILTLHSYQLSGQFIVRRIVFVIKFRIDIENLRSRNNQASAYCPL